MEGRAHRHHRRRTHPPDRDIFPPPECAETEQCLWGSGHPDSHSVHIYFETGYVAYLDLGPPIIALLGFLTWIRAGVALLRLT